MSLSHFWEILDSETNHHNLGMLFFSCFGEFLIILENPYLWVLFDLTGKADKHLCDAILSELKQAAVKTTDDPIRQGYTVILCSVCYR